MFRQALTEEHKFNADIAATNLAYYGHFADKEINNIRKLTITRIYFMYENFLRITAAVYSITVMKQNHQYCAVQLYLIDLSATLFILQITLER